MRNFASSPANHKTFLAFLTAFFLLNFVYGRYAQQQTETVTRSMENPHGSPSPNSQVKILTINGKQIADNGFFTYEITGTEKDSELYRIAKEKFIQTNPEKYKLWVEQSRKSGKITISKNDFERMPKEKQNSILSNPGMYEVK